MIIDTISGANSQELDSTTDANGQATFIYAGQNVGKDTVQAVAWSQGEVSAYSAQVTVSWIQGAPPGNQAPLAIPGWIASPANRATVQDQVPIILAQAVHLQVGTVDYWPVNHPELVRELVSNVSGSGGSTLTYLDTTLLANGSYVIRLRGVDTQDNQVHSGVMITVQGEYKPGRVRFSVTDLVVPVTGLPITIGRTYDSLERDFVGDFGHGWTLDLAGPRVEVDAADNVTLTMPDGKRVAFYFTPYAPRPLFGFLLVKHYTPEPGVYGSLTSDGCGLLTTSGGSYTCFPGSRYHATTFTYTDPYGRKFVMGADGSLKSIEDLNGNTLTFADNGITSSSGNMHVSFDRDEQGRIYQITDPMGHVYAYGYDTNGDLVSVTLPDTDLPILYDYYDTPELAHFFLSGTDPRGHTVATAAYYPDGPSKGRLASVTDALNNTTYYAYDLDAHTTTITNPTPDGGAVELTYDEAKGGKLVRKKVLVTDSPVPEYQITQYDYDPTTFNLIEEVADPDGLNLRTSYTYNENGQRTSVTNPLGVTVITAIYNQYGGPQTISGPEVLVEDASGTLVSGHNVIQVAYNSTFMPSDITDTLGYVGGYTYLPDNHGNPQSQKDGEEQPTSFVYDAYGNITEQRDPLGRTTKFGYDDLGRQTWRIDPCETNPQGCRTDYQYDALGRLRKVIAPPEPAAPTGHITEYEYDANGNRTKVIEHIGSEAYLTEYSYDEANQLTDVTNPQGMVTHYEYDTMGRQVQVITNYVDGIYDSNHPDQDLIREMKYDLAGQLLEEKTPSCCGSGEVTTYTYDAAGRQVSVTTQGVTTTYVYDAAGRVREEHYPMGYVVEYTYNAAGQLIAREDQNQHITRYHYDVRGRLVRVLNPDGSQIAYAYDKAGRQTDITELNGTITHQSYNAAGQLVEVIQAYGVTGFEAVTHYDYDLETGLQTQVIDPLGHVTRFSYDALGRQTQVVENYIDGDFDSDDPDQDVSRSMVYDELGRLTDVTDANGTVTHYDYNEVGQRTQTITNYVNGEYDSNYPDEDLIEAIGYDDAGRQVSSTDPNGRTTIYAYDDLGHLHSVTNPEQETTTYLYNTAGRLQIMRDANGHETQYEYDALGRLWKKHWADGSSYEQYAYDGVGNLTSHRLADGITNTFVYDAMNRLQTAHYFDGQTISYDYTNSGQVETVLDARGEVTYEYDPLDRPTSVEYGEQSIDYSYDVAGNRRTMTTPAEMISYDYDGLNRLFSVTATGGQTAYYTYDPVGLLMQFALPNGITTTYGYDDAYRPTSIVHNLGAQTLDSYTYSYDAAGNRTQVTEYDGTVISWQYDNAYRLRTETRNGSTTSYTYDDTGNRLSMTEDGVTTYSVYNALDQLLCTRSTTGNDCLTDVLTSYGYDGRGNLDTESDGTTTTTYTFDARDYLRGVTDGTTTTTYTYDAGGRRISENLNGTLTNYRWDEFSPYGDIVVETDSAGTIQANYVLGNGHLISQTRGGTTGYYLTDALGSVRALTNAAGAILNTYDYNAFGDLYAQTGTSINPYLYTGQRFDATTEQYYLRAREYDPMVGRFLSQDTWAVDTWNPVELNRYVYAGNGPVNFYDPSGYGLVESGNLKEQIATATSFLSASGPALQMAYVRAMVAVYRWTPWLMQATCLIAEFGTDADLGPTCNVLPDIDLHSVQSVGRIFKVGDDHFGAQLVRLIRQTAEKMHVLEAGKKNIAVIRYAVNGKRYEPLFSVSGDGHPLEKFIRDAGGEVADNIKWPLISGTRQADSEIKGLNHLLNHALAGLGPGDHVSIELYTELFPCHSCGGQFFDETTNEWVDAGLLGVIGEFSDYLEFRHVTVDKVVYWKVYKGAKKP